MYCCASSRGISRFSRARTTRSRRRSLKLIIFATDRCAEVSSAGSTPSTSTAVAVDVLARANASAELRLAGDVREDSQLDLRAVGRERLVPRLGDERGADLAAELGADRDRLQVRVRRRQATGRGHGLVDRRVQAPVLGDQARERAEVRVQELEYCAIPRSRRRARARRGSCAGRACRSRSPSCPCARA